MANLPQVKTANVPMFGGLDLTTPHDRIKPGFVYEAQNFQAVITGGYQTIRGYERTCGNPVFHTNDWYSLTLSDVSSLQLGDIIKSGIDSARVVAIDTENKQVCIVSLDGDFIAGSVITIER